MTFTKIKHARFGLALLAASTALAAAPAFAQVPQIGQFREDPGTALNRHLRTLAEQPRNLSALTGAGKAALALGDAQAALTFYARAEEIAPRDGRVKAGMGSAFLQMEQLAPALKFFEEAVSLGAPEAELAGDRGLAYDLVGDSRRAQADYAASLRREENPEIRRRLALSLAINGERDKALATIDEQLRRQDRSAWRTRAFILALSGDAAGATRTTETVMPGLAGQMSPFYAKLASLNPVQRAFAVHFGQMPKGVQPAPQAVPPPTRYADAAPVPRPAPPASRESSRREAARQESSRREAARQESSRQQAQRAEAALAERNAIQQQREAARQESIRQQAQRRTQAAEASSARASAATQQRDAARSERVRRPFNRSDPFDRFEDARASQQRRSGRTASPMQSAAAQPRAGFPQAAPTQNQAAQNQLRQFPAAPGQVPVATPPAAIAQAPQRPVAPPAAELPRVQPAPIAPPFQPAGPPPGLGGAVFAPQPAPVQQAPVVQPAPAPIAQAPVPIAQVQPSAAGGVVPVELRPSRIAEPSPPSSLIPSGFAGSAPTPAGPTQTEPPAIRQAGTPEPAFTEIAAAIAELPPERDPESSAITESPAQLAQLDVKNAAAAPAAPRASRPTAEPASKPAVSANKVESARREEPRKTQAAKKEEPAKEDPKKLALAKKEGAAKKDAAAKKEAAKKEAAKPKEPSRIWVQIAGGADKAALPREFARMKDKAPKLLGAQSAWTTPLRFTNRLLVGPFKSEKEAQAFVNELNKLDFSAFSWTSPAGQEIEKLASR